MHRANVAKRPTAIARFLGEVRGRLGSVNNQRPASEVRDVGEDYLPRADRGNCQIRQQSKYFGRGGAAEQGKRGAAPTMSRKGGDVRFSSGLWQLVEITDASTTRCQSAVNLSASRREQDSQSSFRKDPPVAGQNFIRARIVDSVVSRCVQRHSHQQLVSSDNSNL